MKRRLKLWLHRKGVHFYTKPIKNYRKVHTIFQMTLADMKSFTVTISVKNASFVISEKILSSVLSKERLVTIYNCPITIN